MSAIYKSHGTQMSTWIEINSANGRIEIKECLDNKKGGYELVRRESFPANKSITFTVGLRVGYFKLRKNAENFALVAAMHINGDIHNPELLDPRKFGGVPYKSSPEVDRLRQAFWTGVQQENPRAGWKDIDLAGVLDRMPDPYFPYGDCWTLEESKATQMPLSSNFVNEERDGGLCETVGKVVLFYKQNLFRDALQISIEERVRKLAVENIAEDDLPYAILLVLSRLRNKIPAPLIFPNHMIPIRQTIRKCWEKLPQSAHDYIDAWQIANSD